MRGRWDQMTIRTSNHFIEWHKMTSNRLKSVKVIVNNFKMA